jgi:hypothetical protein
MYQPGSMKGKNMYIMRNDDDVFTGMTDQQKHEYKCDPNNYSKVAWRQREHPNNHWAVPAVPGHKYRIVWGDSFDLDWSYMRLEVIGYLWTDEEGDFTILMPFREYREGADVVREPNVI